MSDSEKPQTGGDGEEPDVTPELESDSGPNLTLIYSLIGLALAVAIGLAALIVRPFYLRH
jgi:hypothetical protein